MWEYVLIAITILNLCWQKIAEQFPIINCHLLAYRPVPQTLNPTNVTINNMAQFDFSIGQTMGIGIIAQVCGELQVPYALVTPFGFIEVVNLTPEVWEVLTPSMMTEVWRKLGYYLILERSEVDNFLSSKDEQLCFYIKSTRGSDFYERLYPQFCFLEKPNFATDEECQLFITRHFRKYEYDAIIAWERELKLPHEPILVVTNNVVRHEKQVNYYTDN